MSDVIAAAVSLLSGKLDSFDGIARFVIEDEGSIIVDGAGVRAGGDDGDDEGEAADVTLTASRETFESILDGSTSATAAFMSGRLKIDGDMGAAMRLGSALG